jgi:hypothetical protein
MTEAAQEGTQGQQATPEDQGTTQPTQGTQEAAQTQEKAFSQKDVDKLVGGRVMEDRNTRAKEAGFESYDAMREAAQGFAQQREAEMTKLQKAEQAQTKLQGELESARKTIAEIRQEYALRDALRDRGVTSETMADALRLADIDSLDVDDKGNITGVEEVVNSLLEPRPWLAGAPVHVAPDTTPTPPAPVDFSNMSEEEFAKLQDRALTGEFVIP